jgi:hypothetical protein
MTIPIPAPRPEKADATPATSPVLDSRRARMTAAVPDAAFFVDDELHLVRVRT